MDKKVVIIDYQLGNLFSVNQALKNIGLETIISSNPNDIISADAIVLPGVGAFGDAMNNLINLGLTTAIKDFVNTGKPFLGICLGLQLLFTDSEEFGSSKGLDLINGTVKRFSNIDLNNERVRVPQITWNTISMPNDKSWENTPLFDIKNNEDMYFVHSYYVVPSEKGVDLTYTSYGGLKYVSSVLKNNILACQFHPEKSANEGLKIYKNWAKQNNLLNN
jgi:glutamine amidotransferase